MTRQHIRKEVQLRILAVVAVLGLATAVATWFAGLMALAFFGTFLTVYGAVMAVVVADNTFLNKAAESWLDEWVREKNAMFSFYGLMALAYFIKWEVPMLLREVLEFDFSADRIVRAFITKVLGICVETFRNALMSMVWPWHVYTSYELVIGLLVVGLCAVIVWAGTQWFDSPKWEI